MQPDTRDRPAARLPFRVASAGRGSLASLGALALLALVGCGGGGGGSSPPSVPSPPAPTLTLSASTVAVTGSINSADQPQLSLLLTVANPPVGELLFQVTSTSVGLAGAGAQAETDSAGSLALSFKPASSLVPGIYNDTVSVSLCADANCTSLVAGTTHTIDVTYTVTAPAANAEPTLTFSQTAVSYHQLYIPTDPSPDPYDAAPTPIGVTFTNFGVRPFVTVTNSVVGITGAPYAATDDTHSTITPAFRAQNQLGPGTYSDTIQVTACLDSACVNPVPGSPFTIPLTYTIDGTTTTSGTYGYTVTVLPLGALDIAWDAARAVFYVAEGVTPFFPNAVSQVATLDPATGESGTAAALPSLPNTLTLSDDGSLLYVGLWGSIRRFTVPALTPDITITLGQDAGGGYFYAGDMRTLPGAPHSLLVARGVQVTPGQTSGLVLFDDAVVRGSALGAGTQPPFVATLEFGADASVLYGGSVGLPTLDLYTLSIGPSGVALGSDAQQVGSGRLHYANQFLYTDDGKVFDPATATIVGGYPGNAYVTAVLPDLANGRIFAISNATGASPAVQLFDPTFKTLLASVPLVLGYGNITRVVRYGSQGLALVGDSGYVVLISGAFVAP